MEWTPERRHRLARFILKENALVDPVCVHGEIEIGGWLYFTKAAAQYMIAEDVELQRKSWAQPYDIITLYFPEEEMAFRAQLSIV